ncbi:MAG: hypothetical protein M3360_09225 [Actinomycetota bacterium]|nr:hypothetical protein [Actinomycetota bacterium]
MMVAVIVVVLLLGLALAYVLTPLRRGGGEPDDPDPRGQAEADAEDKKNSALGALVDLEDEREVGKLSTADFEMLRREYEAEALAALHELDDIHFTYRTDEALEAEIAAVRAGLECPSCGGARPPGEPCPRCGA